MTLQQILQFEHLDTKHISKALLKKEVMQLRVGKDLASVAAALDITGMNAIA